MFYEYILSPSYTVENSKLVSEVESFWAQVQAPERKISYMFSLVMT